MIKTGFSQINRYLSISLLKGLGLSLAFVMTIIGLVAFVELSRSIGSRINIGFLNLVFLTILQLPSLIEQTLPIIFLTGSLWTLFHLNRNNELVVLRASSLSVWNILTVFMFLAFLTGLLAAGVYNPVSSYMKTHFEGLKNEWVYEKRNMPFTANGIWMREGNTIGQTVIHAEAADFKQIALKNVTLYQYEYNSKNLLSFVRRIDAKIAYLKPGFWQFEKVQESRSGALTNTYAHMSLPTRLNLESIYAATSYFSKTPSFWELPKIIKETSEAGFSTRKLLLHWHGLMAQPLILVAMVLIASLVSLRPARLGGVLKLVTIGGIVGFLLYFINGLLYSLGQAGHLPILLAVWTAPLFALCCSLSILFFTEDG